MTGLAGRMYWLFYARDRRLKCLFNIALIVKKIQVTELVGSMVQVKLFVAFAGAFTKNNGASNQREEIMNDGHDISLHHIRKSEQQDTAASDSYGRWLPIDTAPEAIDILCFCEDYEPSYFVGKFRWKEETGDVLISEKGNRKTYETITKRERDWGDSPSWGATHWMPLPERP